MFGRIHSEAIWSWALIYKKVFDYRFNILTSYGLVYFLFLHDLVLVGGVFLEICPFHLYYLISWPLLGVLPFNSYFCKVSTDVPFVHSCF